MLLLGPQANTTVRSEALTVPLCFRLPSRLIGGPFVKAKHLCVYANGCPQRS